MTSNVYITDIHFTLMWLQYVFLDLGVFKNVSEL